MNKARLSKEELEKRIQTNECMTLLLRHTYISYKTWSRIMLLLFGQTDSKEKGKPFEIQESPENDELL